MLSLVLVGEGVLWERAWQHSLSGHRGSHDDDDDDDNDNDDDTNDYGDGDGKGDGDGADADDGIVLMVRGC